MQLHIGESITTIVSMDSGLALRAPRNDELLIFATYPTNPFIGFTGALSGNTLSASTRSARPN